MKLIPDSTSKRWAASNSPQGTWFHGHRYGWRGWNYFAGPSQKVHIILRNNFGHPVEFDFPIQSTNPIFSVKLNGEEPPQFSVQGDLEWKLYDYGINPVYRSDFLSISGLYVGLGFIGIIRNLYAIQLKRRYETERKIASLQLSGIKADGASFIFNVINSIWLDDIPGEEGRGLPAGTPIFQHGQIYVVLFG